MLAVTSLTFFVLIFGNLHAARMRFESSAEETYALTIKYHSPAFDDPRIEGRLLEKLFSSEIAALGQRRSSTMIGVPFTGV
jgi:hypothetical protein